MRVEKDRLLDLLESENATLGDALASSEEQMRTLQAALSEQTLQAVSYDAMRERISSLRIPFAQVQHNALQALLDGNTKNASAASALPETSPGVADTDEALRRIDDLSCANDAIRGAMEQAAAAGATDTLNPSCQRAMAANDALIANLQNVIAQIEAYAAASSSFYQGAQQTAQALSSASTSIADGLMGHGYGDITLMKAAFRISDEEVSKRLGVSKQEFIDMQREQYGFDEETAQAMWDVYAALYTKYPNADQQFIDHMWLRIMSQVDYNGTKWEITAGRVSDVGDDGKLVSGDDFVTQTLGIDPDEWAKLKLAIATQHAYCDGTATVSSTEYEKLKQLYRDVYKTEDGFDETYIKTSIQKYGMHDNPSPHGSPDKVAYADFSHQCATAASSYLDSTSIDFLFSGGADERKSYAGWLGDCLIKGNDEGDATLGPDDYKADLDADSISRRARGQGTSYQQAARNYYNEIAAGTTNRADEFLSNHNGYDNIVNSIYENLQHEDVPLSYTDTEVEITHDDFFHDESILFFKHSPIRQPAPRKRRTPLADRSTSRIRRGFLTR